MFYEDFNPPWWADVEKNRKILQEAENKLNRDGILYGDDLIDLFGSITEVDYEEPEIPYNGMMEFIALEADISYKFIELEHRIEVMSGC